MTSEHLAELRERIQRAHTELGDVCAEGPSRRFRMTVPADPGRDSDLIITAGLEAGDALLAEVERLRARALADDLAYKSMLKRAEKARADANELGAQLRLSFPPGLYLEIQQVLDRALGTEEKDGAGAGIVADVALVVDRLANADERLDLARTALLADGYFKPEEVGPDIAPRIVERLAVMREQIDHLQAELTDAHGQLADAQEVAQ
ncbi:hypothetical protein [Acrocarpospora sp. B8E8]|uniref:hypothetical protein n=1 Tax=Acrocarpospora sp. B8E8 TaxID=3153572 RepID=UPI00325FB6E2